MINNIVIIGAGDTGREYIDLIERINRVEKKWNIIGFVDDNPNIQGGIIDGFPILGTVDWLNLVENEVYAVCSISKGSIKKKVISKIISPRVKFATLIDPNVIICNGSRCEEGAVVYAGTVLAINTRIGKHVYVSFNSSIGHDTVIGDYCNIYPGVIVSGKVTLGECSDLGTGTKIIQGLSIGKNVTIGAGAVVIKDILENCTAVGAPAKPIKFNK